MTIIIIIIMTTSGRRTKQQEEESGVEDDVMCCGGYVTLEHIKTYHEKTPYGASYIILLESYLLIYVTFYEFIPLLHCKMCRIRKDCFFHKLSSKKKQEVLIIEL